METSVRGLDDTEFELLRRRAANEPHERIEWADPHGPALDRLVAAGYMGETLVDTGAMYGILYNITPRGLRAYRAEIAIRRGVP